MRLLPVLILGTLAGCGSPKADFEKLCNAAELSGAAGITDPEQKTIKMTTWLADNIRSQEAIDTVKAVALMNPADKGPFVQAAAIEAGYTGPCPMAAEPKP